MVWNPILLKCILYSFRAQLQNTSCRRLQRFWHRQHGQVNDSFICAPRNIERKCGAFIVSMFYIFLVVNLHTMFSRKSHCLPPSPWPWPIMGNLLDVGRTSTPNTNTLGWKVWTSYAPLTWFHQHYGGIFAYDGQGIFENPRSCVPISSIFICIQNFESMGVIYSLALQHIRNICMNELFTFKKISFQPMKTKEIQEIIKK